MEDAVKIGRNTQERIELIKDEAGEVERKIDNLIARLSEHAGTKRMASKLERVKVRLHEWRTTT